MTRFVRLRSLAGEPCRVRPGITAAGASSTVQAETGTISQGVVESNHAGFTGTGFVNYDNVIGSFVELPITVPAAGPVTLSFRFANGTTVNRPMRLAIDGVSVGTLNFPGTGAWTTWQTVSSTVTLTAGAHTVRATATTADGGPNLDALSVTPQGSALTVTLDDGTPASWRDIGNGVIEIDLARGREVLIHAAGAPPALTVAPVPISNPGAAWGLP